MAELMFKLLTRNVVEEMPMLAGKSGHRVQHGTRRHARQRDALPSEEVVTRAARPGRALLDVGLSAQPPHGRVGVEAPRSSLESKVWGAAPGRSEFFTEQNTSFDLSINLEAKCLVRSGQSTVSEGFLHLRYTLHRYTTATQ